MTSIRILHASDLHISRRSGYTSAIDRVSAGLSLKRIINIAAHPGQTIAKMKRTAVVSTYDEKLLLHFAQLVYDDCHRQPNHNLGTPVDAIMLTGDLATTGLDEDLERVREFLDGPQGATPTETPSRHPTLAAINQSVVGKKAESLPVWILPGNHDRYRRVSLQVASQVNLHIDYSPGGKNFENKLPSYWGKPFPKMTDWGPDVIEFPTLSKDGLNVTLIAADFNLKDKRDRDGRLWYHKYAQGRVYMSILRQLAIATEDVKNRYKNEQPHVVLWAIHFPPGFPKLSATMQLIDEDDLLRAAEYLEVRAILSGHTHTHLSYSTQGTQQQQVFCAGTASQLIAPLGNFFGIVEVNADPAGHVSIQHECFRYKKLKSDFVKVRHCTEGYLRRLSKL